MGLTSGFEVARLLVIPICENICGFIRLGRVSVRGVGSWRPA
jgi:hypothetical protein